MSIQVNGQYKNIDVPKITEVATFDDVDLFIPLYLDLENGERVIYLNDEVIKDLDSIPILLEHEFDKIIEKDFLKLQFTIIELIAHRDLRMKEVNEVLTKLRQYNLNNIILSSKSEFLSRIDQVWTTGTYHEFDILSDYEQSIKSNQNYPIDLKAKSIEKFIIKDVQNSHKTKNDNDLPPKMPPPPPPPPPMIDRENIEEVIPQYFSEDMKQKFPNCQYIHVDINDETFKLFNTECSKISDLEKLLRKINIDYKTIFVLNTLPNSKYQNYVEVLATFNKLVYEQRQSLAQELYDTEFLKLEAILFDEIVLKVPYNIIEKPIN